MLSIIATFFLLTQVFVWAAPVPLVNVNLCGANVKTCTPHSYIPLVCNSGFTLTGPAGKLGTQCSSSQGVVKAKMAHAGSDNAVPLV